MASPASAEHLSRLMARFIRFFRLVCLAVFLAVQAGVTAVFAQQKSLQEWATELCRPLTTSVVLQDSVAPLRGWLTEDFYTVLDTYSRLPWHMDSYFVDWQSYFGDDDGDWLMACRVVSVEAINATLAVAVLQVNSYAKELAGESPLWHEARMTMELVDGSWRVADYDGCKARLAQAITDFRQLEPVREAMLAYLADSVAPRFVHWEGEFCIPALAIMARDTLDANHIAVRFNSWVYWYKIRDNRLDSFCGGNVSGCMTLSRTAGIGSIEASDSIWSVTAFDETQQITNAWGSVIPDRDAVIVEHVRAYVRRHAIPVRTFRFMGLNPVEL